MLMFSFLPGHVTDRQLTRNRQKQQRPSVRDDEGKESFIEIGDELEDNWKQHYTKKEASLVTQ